MWRKRDQWTIVHENSYLNCLERVERFFGSSTKAVKWMETENPMLGDFAPNEMIIRGRVDRLLKFIVLAEEERCI